MTVRNSAKTDRQGYSPVEFPPVGQAGLFGRWLWRWDVRTGKRLSSIQCLASRAGRALWLGLLWSPIVRGIVREIRSLPGRIRTIYATRVYRNGVDFGPIGPIDSQREETHACIRDTQRIASYYPWATLLDVKLVVQAWRMGAEWASAYRSTPLLCSRCKATESLAIPEGRNSMPPLAVQQPTKRDLLAPLPSRDST
jgi:hypothetical protein